jgi:hypothetical protein
MKHTSGALIIIAALFLCVAPTTQAERPAEPKETADYQLTAKVEAVFERTRGRLREHVVLLSVRQVHKGEGVNAGDLFYAYCFKMQAAPVPQTEASGHNAVPEEGQLIKAYVRKRKGRNEGTYKDWFEVLDTDTPDATGGPKRPDGKR